jgi:hypothetical protein
MNGTGELRQFVSKAARLSTRAAFVFGLLVGVDWDVQPARTAEVMANGRFH